MDMNGHTTSRIFISYAYEDLDSANRIVDALAKNDLDTWINWKSIPKGEDWQQEIYRGVEEADAFLFLISPDSVISEPCKKEIDHAVKNNKRILPIVLRDADPQKIPSEISKPNWIFCRDGQDDFNKAIEEIRKTIHTDYEWLKYHTELQVKALKWEQRKDNSRLLRGKELQVAEEQLAKAGNQKDPQPTELQRNFIFTSRRHEDQKRRRQTVGLGVGSLLLAGLCGAAVIASVFAVGQRNSAINSQNTAVAETNIRSTAQAIAEEQARVSRAGELAAQAVSEIKRYPQRSLLLAVESLYQTHHEDSIVPQAWQSLFYTLNTTQGIGLGSSLPVDYSKSDEMQFLFSNDNKYLVILNNRFGLNDQLNQEVQETVLDIYNLLALDPYKKAGYIRLPKNSRLIGFAPDNRLFYYSPNELLYLDLDAADIERKSIVLKEIEVKEHSLSENGNNLIILDKKTNIHMWNLSSANDSGKEWQTGLETLAEFQVSANNQWGVIRGEDSAYTLWDLSQFPPDSSKSIPTSEGYSRSDTKMLLTNNYLFVDYASSEIQIFRNEHDSMLKKVELGNIQKTKVTGWSISPDASVFAACDENGYLSVWDLDSNELLLFMPLEDSSATCYPHISPDNNWIIVNNRIWDLSISDPTSKSLAFPSLMKLIFSPNGRWLATGTIPAGSDVGGIDIMVFDLKLVHEQFVSPSQNTTEIETFWYSDPLWNQLSIELHGHEWPADPVTFSLDGNWLITSSNWFGSSTRLWPLYSETYDTNSVRRKGAALVLNRYDQVSSSGKWLIQRGTDSLSVWDIKSGAFHTSYNIKNFGTSSVFYAISNDNRWLFIPSDDGNIHVFDLNSKSNEIYKTLKVGNEEVKSLLISPNDKWLIVAVEQRIVAIEGWHDEEPSVTQIEEFNQSHELIIQFSDNSRWLFIGYSGDRIALWDLNDRSLQTFWSEKGANIHKVSFSPNSEWIAMIISFDNDPPLPVISRTAERNFWLLESNFGYAFSADLAFSPNSLWLFTATPSSQYAGADAYIWDLRTVVSHQENISFYRLQHNSLLTTYSNFLEISPDGSLLASVQETTVHMWNLADLSIQPIILSHGRARSIRDIDFSENAKWFATASSERGDETLILWALTRDDYPPITVLSDEEMSSVQFIPDSDLMRAELFIGDSQLFLLDSGYLRELACVVAGRNFTQAEWTQYFPSEEYRITCPQWTAGQ